MTTGRDEPSRFDGVRFSVKEVIGIHLFELSGEFFNGLIDVVSHPFDARWEFADEVAKLVSIALLDMAKASVGWVKPRSFFEHPNR